MKLIFLSYLNRSGSTFFTNQLNNFSQILAIPEMNFFLPFFLSPNKFTQKKKVFKKILFSFNRINHFFSIDEINEIIGCNSIFEAFIITISIYKNKNKPKADLVLFKIEQIYQYLSLFPEGFTLKNEIKIIAIFRNPYSIFASQKTTKLPDKRRYFNTNPLITAYAWKSFFEKTVEYKTKHKLLIISYEDLILNAETTLVKVEKFLEVNLIRDSSCENMFYYGMDKTQQQLHTHIILPPQSTYINKWKNKLSPIELSLIETTCKPAMNNLGYLPTLKKKPLSLRIFLYRFYYKLRIFLKIDIY